ncbi:Casein kinase II subunit alpha' [Parelaphostrongylus tenuis]|uniref:Casein kinase II subunit alpha n=1 Tax=Parelaphostrongylus tenuis TaxID=148309 RepID=A0AAD5QES7_PARTN|nr:Casein kinase II subunit alpha' [Parelaphostrongylus tenuis]
MSIAEGHFRGMKELLSTMEPDTDANEVKELKQRTHMLCARFLGGAWKTVPLEQLRISRIKGGMSNMLFLCRLSELHRPIRNEPDKVLLRVYFNPETENHLVAESVIFTLLSERHLGPKLYGIFSGGRLEEYIPSRPLTCREIALPMMSSKIAKRLSKVHQLEVPIWKEPDYICDALQRWLCQLMRTPTGQNSFILPSQYSQWAPEFLTCEHIARELDYLREMVSKSRSPVAFCHNDLQEGNILLPKASSGNIRLSSICEESIGSLSLRAFNPADPRLVLIDFEYASYNYRGFDFANHFVEYTIDYDVAEHPHYQIYQEQFPEDEQIIDFFVSYLREFGDFSESQLNSKAEELLKETLPFVPVSHFFWGVWGLLQVELSPVGFGFAEYGRDRLGLYFQTRYLLKMFNDDQCSDVTCQ